MKKTIGYIILLSYALIAILMLLVYYVSLQFNIPFKEITGDPVLTFNAHPFTGIVSNIGILLWCASCSILVFSYFLAKDKLPKKEAFFLLYSGCITFLLLIDDLFMIHDYLLYSIGSNQYVMYTLYLILFIFYFIYFKDILINLPYKPLFILAFFFLGSSVGLDIVFKSEGLQYFIEDGLKLLGINSWFLFFTNYALLKLKS